LIDRYVIDHGTRGRLAEHLDEREVVGSWCQRPADVGSERPV